jgi:hypothetical protein
VAYDGGFVNLGQNYAVTGGAVSHVNTNNFGSVLFQGTPTITLTGSPAFTTSIYSGRGSIIIMQNYAGSRPTISGTATGKRYIAEYNGIIDTAGGGATYIFGDAAGSTATQGQYF